MLTIGRIVQYGAGGVVLPAIVTWVWSDTCVNLFVFPDGSHPQAVSGIKMSVQLQEGDGPGLVDGKWRWPVRGGKVLRDISERMTDASPANEARELREHDKATYPNG